ncbi:MAG TPA: hypothetical protein ENK18_27920 [Deltaproteobacteria bacterium]|nr:hypothetical protein [Deltaproteobacteria bacterium]
MWVWIWFACGGDKLETMASDTGAEDDPPALATASTADSAPGITYFDAQWIYVSAQLGYNANTQRISTVEYSNKTFGYPYIEIVMATDGWDRTYTDIEEYCSILLVLESSEVADWVIADDRLVWGIDWDPADLPLSTCGGPGYELDPLDWGVNIVQQFAGDGGWGVAIGDLTPELAAALEPVFKDQFPHIVGGTFRIPDMLPGDPLDDIYGFAYAVDDDMIVLDADADGLLDLIPADELHDGTELLRSAWILLYTTTYWGN